MTESAGQSRSWLFLTQYYPPEVGSPQVRLPALWPFCARGCIRPTENVRERAWRTTCLSPSRRPWLRSGRNAPISCSSRGSPCRWESLACSFAAEAPGAFAEAVRRFADDDAYRNLASRLAVL
jgi:hypothetical protein